MSETEKGYGFSMSVNEKVGGFSEPYKEHFKNLLIEHFRKRKRMPF